MLQNLKGNEMPKKSTYDTILDVLREAEEKRSYFPAYTVQETAKEVVAALEKEDEVHVLVLVRYPDASTEIEMFETHPELNEIHEKDFIIMSVWPNADHKYWAYEIEVEVLET